MSSDQSDSNLNQLLSKEPISMDELRSKFAARCPNLQEKLDELKDALKKSSLTSDLDDHFLLRFLNVRNFDVKNTLLLIEGYFGMRKNFPHFFLPPSKVMQVFEDEVFTLAVNEEDEERTLLIFQPGKWDPKKYPADVIAAGPVPFFEMICAVYGQVNVIEILDFDQVTWKQFTAMPVTLHKQSADLTERAMPITFSNIHIVNQGKLVDMLWAIMKPFVSDEMKKKLVFHGTDFTNLRECIDEHLLPVRFGGKLTTTKLSSEAITLLDDRVNQYWSKYHP